MAGDLLIANLCFFSDDGHNHFRVHAPARALARADAVTAVDCDLYHRQVPWLAAHADVLVLHGLNPDWYPVIHRRRARGLATVFDASDHYLDVQPWRPYSAGWLDRSLQDLFWQTVEAVDAVQTSTEGLARVWRPRARRVLVLPNPADEVPPLDPLPDRPLTVGWAGSGTHLADWAAVAPTLERWVAARPAARLAVMTDERAAGLVRLPPPRYAFRPPGTLAAYRAFLRALDVGVVPLLPGPFNDGRTDLKFLDYAAAGVPGIYPRAGPYTAAVDDGRTGLLYDSPAGLADCLTRLADDPGLRAGIREAAHREAVRRRSANDVGGWIAEYRKLLGGPGRAPALPDDLRAAAVADGRYLRLEPGPPEQLVAAAIQGPSTADLAAALGELVRAYPGYAAAVRALARVLNDLGRHGEAMEVAEPAVADDPDNPSGRIELARALIGLDRPDEGRYHLERAAVANPRHPVAWHLLRETAAEETDADRAALLWARNAPSQFMPAVAAVAARPPDEAAEALAGVVARFTPTLHPEERPYAASAFAHAAGVLAEALPPDRMEPVLRELAAAFPESARAADLYGECLYHLGRTAEADAEFTRAAGLHRAAVAARLDAEACEGRVWRWQVAEYAARSRRGHADG